MKDRLVLETMLKDDITVYYPLKCYHGDTVEYECTPYSLAGSICSYSNANELLDFLKGCFEDKDECQVHCNLLNKHYDDEENNEKIYNSVHYDANTYEIHLNNPSAEEVCDAAMEAIVEKRKGVVRIKNTADGKILLYVNGFCDSGSFGKDCDDRDICLIWAKYCDKYNIWDDFEKDSPTNNDEDE